MTNTGAAPTEYQVNVQWMNDPTRVPTPVNQFIIQAGPAVTGQSTPDAWVLQFGHVTPPLLTEPPTAEQFDELRNTVALVVPSASLYLTQARLRELHGKLGEILAQVDAAK